MKNKKYFFRLMASGRVEKTYQKTKRHKLRKVIWNVVHYSKLKHVYAPDEEVARYLIYDMLTENKWTGFRLRHIEQPQ